MGEFVGKRVVPDHVGVWDQKKTMSLDDRAG